MSTMTGVIWVRKYASDSQCFIYHVVIFFFQGFLTTISQATCYSTLQHFMNDLKKCPIGLMCYFAGAPAAGKSSTYDSAVRRPLAAITKEFQKSISSMVCILYVYSLLKTA